MGEALNFLETYTLPYLNLSPQLHLPGLNPSLLHSGPLPTQLHVLKCKTQKNWIIFSVLGFSNDFQSICDTDKRKMTPTLFPVSFQPLRPRLRVSWSAARSIINSSRLERDPRDSVGRGWDPGIFYTTPSMNQHVCDRHIGCRYWC